MTETNLSIELANPTAAFEPGDECVGKVSWEGSEVPQSAELRLIWKMESEGPEDYGLALTQSFDHPHAREARGFRLTLPEGPYSFKGRIIELTWYLELVVKPYKNVARASLIIAPGGQPLELEQRSEKPGGELGQWFSKFKSSR